MLLRPYRDGGLCLALAPARCPPAGVSFYSVVAARGWWRGQLLLSCSSLLLSFGASAAARRRRQLLAFFFPPPASSPLPPALPAILPTTRKKSSAYRRYPVQFRAWRPGLRLLASYSFIIIIVVRPRVGGLDRWLARGGMVMGRRDEEEADAHLVCRGFPAPTTTD